MNKINKDKQWKKDFREIHGQDGFDDDADLYIDFFEKALQRKDQALIEKIDEYYHSKEDYFQKSDEAELLYAMIIKIIKEDE